MPEEEIPRRYAHYRRRVMEATFLGYGTFYLVRNNFSAVSKDIQAALHYDHAMIGNILAATAVSYGVGKFVMGAVSDRCNARRFVAVGLLLTAACNFAFSAVASYHLHLFLWSLNGLVQGMGWPPCGRCMAHWFSERERGLTFSIWNTSHNVGGGLAGMIAAWAAGHYGGWQYAFIFPGILATIGAVYLLTRLCDTPQSVGLPPIEEYNNDYPPGAGPHGTHERELGTYELLFGYVLSNKYIWLLAAANFFAYVTRYSMLDWAPMYLREVKGATLAKGGLAIFVNEFGGIPSTIFLGWLSDRLKGRRGMVAVLCIFPMLAAFAILMVTPPGYLWLDMIMLAALGFFIYPVINLIIIMALDLTSKKAIGTAAGFIGLVGYLGRGFLGFGGGWLLKHYQPLYGVDAAWKIVLGGMTACTAVPILLLALTWRIGPMNGRR